MTSQKASNIKLKHVMGGEGIRDVDPTEVKSHQSQITLIDVRRPDEFVGELGHISGVTKVTLETELEAYLANASDSLRNSTVVFVCRSGGRSTRAAIAAVNNGFTDVYNMMGGMMYWNQLGLPIKK
jgi:rhodanese-related sulfurtransferase